MLTPVQNAIIATYHEHAPAISVLHPLYAGLPPTAPAHSTADAWCAAVGPDAAIREALGGLTIATAAAGIFTEWGTESKSGISPDDVVKYMVAGANLLAGVLRAPIFDAPAARSDFLTLASDVLRNKPLEVSWIVWGRGQSEPARCISYTESSLELVLTIWGVDLWKFITDRTWRSAKDEPWLLWSQWAPQLWTFNRVYPLRVLTKENMLTESNNFWMYWGPPGGNYQWKSPLMWRFHRAHPELDAKLRKAFAGKVRELPREEASSLLWDAYQILSGPEYDDLRDRGNQHSWCSV